MKINPVYRQETKISARSFRLPLIVLLCNTILATVALLNMYSMVTQVRATAEIQYSSFLSLYIFVASIEFVMILVIMPALTSGSISGERERQTLNLLLTTRMTPADIVVGKLLASLSTVLLLVVSSFPVLALVFIYGGVTVWDIALVFITFLSTALLTGSIGICCSSVFKRTTIATAASYCAIAVLMLGTTGLSRFGSPSRNGAGSIQGFLLLNPAVSFGMAMKGQFNNVRRYLILDYRVGNMLSGQTDSRWLWISIILQMAVSGLCLWASVCLVNPRRKRRWKF